MLRAVTFLLLCLSLLQSAWSVTSVVTSTPDLRSLVEAVGGDRVTVASLVPNAGDAESYAPRPQDVARLRGARLVVRVGLDYDLWLDRLLRQSGDAALQRGASGYLDSSTGITLLEVKTGGLSGGGHAHGAGNPHYWLDPQNAHIITGGIAEALARLDPANAKYYEQRRADFLSRLDKRVLVWQEKLAPMSGQPLMMYHNSWPYFARRFRLNFIGVIEPRPGVGPSPSAMEKLLTSMNREKVKVVVREPQEPSRDVDFLARKSGANVAVLAASVGDLAQANDYLSLFEINVTALLAAFNGNSR